jgi:hypothetical protein
MNKQELIQSLGKKVAQTGAYVLIENRGTLEIHNLGKRIEFDANDKIIYTEDWESAFVGCIAHRQNFKTVVADTQASLARGEW